MQQIEHAYPGYDMERAFLERAVRDNVGVIPELALGLLETTEIYAAQAQSLRELACAYKELANDVTGSNNGPHGSWRVHTKNLPMTLLAVTTGHTARIRTSG